MKHFKGQLFIIIPLNESSHIKVYVLEIDPIYKCTNLLCKFWCQGHFLTGNESYVYKKYDMFKKELCLKKRLLAFFKELGYVGDVTPLDVALKERLKRIIEALLLLNSNNKEERKIIFGECYRFSNLHQFFL